jgi:hypothetical protein
MANLSQLVGEDSRKPVERLRRCQVYKMVEALGITCPPGSPKTMMIKLLEANNVDISKPVQGIPGIDWNVTVGTDSEGRQRQEIYPVAPLHASARKGVNAAEALDRRKQETEKREADKFAESRMAALEKENQRLRDEAERTKAESDQLKAIIEQRLKALEEPKETEQPEVQTSSAQSDYWAMYRKAKGMGLEVKRGMTRDELDTLIKAQS